MSNIEFLVDELRKANELINELREENKQLREHNKRLLEGNKSLRDRIQKYTDLTKGYSQHVSLGDLDALAHLKRMMEQ